MQEKPKITRGFLQQYANVLFHPKTAEEAWRLQDRLFEIGVFWPGDHPRQHQQLEILSSGTLVVNDTKIDMQMRYHSTRRYDGTVCDLTQLEEKYVAPETQEERLERRFNELSAKVDRLTQILERIEAEIVPDRKIDKPSLKV